LSHASHLLPTTPPPAPTAPSTWHPPAHYCIIYYYIIYPRLWYNIIIVLLQLLSLRDFHKRRAVTRTTVMTRMVGGFRSWPPSSVATTHVTHKNPRVCHTILSITARLLITTSTTNALHCRATPIQPQAQTQTTPSLARDETLLFHRLNDHQILHNFLKSTNPPDECVRPTRGLQIRLFASFDAPLRF